MQLKNLTPHPIHIYAEDGTTLLLTIQPEPVPARCAMTKRRLYGVAADGIAVPVYRQEYGEVSGLPLFKDAPDTTFVVSLLVAQAVRDSGQHAPVLAPGEAVRDADGMVIGCIGLAEV